MLVKYKNPDAQDRPPSDRCTRCEGELWGHEAEPDQCGRVLCPSCREDTNPKYDADTVEAVLEIYDQEVSKYLSQNLRDSIWNTVSIRFAEVR